MMGRKFSAATKLEASMPIPQLTPQELAAIQAEKAALLEHVGSFPGPEQDTINGLKDMILKAVSARGAIGSAALHLALTEHQEAQSN